MQKIVYFDEESALDYIILKDGGKKVTENITKFNGTIEGKISAELGDILDENSQNKVASIIKKLVFNSNFGAGGKVDGDLSKANTTTLSNTVLTDYIKKANRDRKVKVFKNIKIEVYPNSMAYYRLYTPYMDLINGANNYQGMNLTNLDNVLNSVKAYTEVISKNGNQMDVLRFNTNTFRNNYKLSDILKMSLDVYAVKVGKIQKNKMELENEIKMVENAITASEILGNKAQSDEGALDVYDVILAGVTDE